MQIDPKGRVALPAKWRTAGELLRLYFVAAPAPHIAVCPDLDEAASEAVTVGPDGRITIPVDLRQKAQLEREVILVGLLDSFQLWSPAEYRVDVSSDLAAEAFRLI